MDGCTWTSDCISAVEVIESDPSVFLCVCVSTRLKDSGFRVVMNRRTQWHTDRRDRFYYLDCWCRRWKLWGHQLLHSPPHVCLTVIISRCILNVESAQLFSFQWGIGLAAKQVPNPISHPKTKTFTHTFPHRRSPQPLYTMDQTWCSAHTRRPVKIVNLLDFQMWVCVWIFHTHAQT